jgi:hypothetical protein
VQGRVRRRPKRASGKEMPQGVLRRKETTIRSKAKMAVLATENTEGAEPRGQEQGAKNRSSESTGLLPSRLRFSLGPLWLPFLALLPGR